MTYSNLDLELGWNVEIVACEQCDNVTHTIECVKCGMDNCESCFGSLGCEWCS